MREILFRGKDIETGEWVFGFYSMQSFGRGFAPAIIQFDGGSTVPLLVNSKTVGQYTGLRDKNSAMIFEGDIVKCDSGFITEVVFGHFTIGSDSWGVEHSTPGFVCKYSDGSGHHGLDPDVEVIGNIHDNPELLAGGH